MATSKDAAKNAAKASQKSAAELLAEAQKELAAVSKQLEKLTGKKLNQKRKRRSKYDPPPEGALYYFVSYAQCSKKGKLIRKDNLSSIAFTPEQLLGAVRGWAEKVKEPCDDSTDSWAPLMITVCRS